MIRTPDNPPTYTPNALKALKLAFRGFTLKDTEYYESHDPHRMEAAMVCALQDQILWLTEQAAKLDNMDGTYCRSFHEIREQLKHVNKILSAYDANCEKLWDADVSKLVKRCNEQAEANGVLGRALDMLKTRVDGLVHMVTQRDEKIVALQNQYTVLCGEISQLKDWIGNHTNVINDYAKRVEALEKPKPKKKKTTKRKR